MKMEWVRGLCRQWNPTKKMDLVKAEAPVPVVYDPDQALTNTGAFAHFQRVGNMLMTSSLLPQRFRGNLGDCFILGILQPGLECLHCMSLRLCMRSTET